MKYPRSCKGRAAFAAVLLLSGCPTVEPATVSYGDPDPEVYNGAGGMGGAPGAAAGSTAAAGRDAGTGGAGGSTVVGGSSGAGDGGDGGGSVATSVSFAVTTAPQGGEYSPKNIGAIWIETASGEFVKSLEVWARLRRRYLTKYNAAVGTSGSVDVLASATLTRHTEHRVTWDLVDRNGTAVAPGAYRLIVEVTDRDSAGKSYSLDFDIGEGAQTLHPSGDTYFRSMSLSVE